MKKIILLLISILLIVFIQYKEALADSNKQYKKDIEKILRNDIPRAKTCVDKNFAKSKEFYIKSTRNKQKSQKYIFLSEDYLRKVYVCEINLISKFIEITGKYEEIDNDIPPTDSIEVLTNFLYPYFDKYNINYIEFKEFDIYTTQKIKELN